MISFSKLLLDHFGDSLRYHGRGASASGAAPGTGPVVVWNCTRSCNLSCRHCYAAAAPEAAPNIRPRRRAAFLRSLADFGVPAVLVSGGEPLMRRDIFDLLERGTSLGLRMVLSTNGVLIDAETARRLKALGVKLRGHQPRRALRGQRRLPRPGGAFDRTLAAFRNCRAVGQRAGAPPSADADHGPRSAGIFRLVEDEKIARVCIYHLVAAGRGAELGSEDLSIQERRDAVDFIAEKTLDFGARSVDTEILTVDNHCDGVYLHLRAKRPATNGRGGFWTSSP